MKKNKKLRLQYLFQNSFFILLFFAIILLVGVLSNQFVFVKDMTQASRSILTKGSVEILESMNVFRWTRRKKLTRAKES